VLPLMLRRRAVRVALALWFLLAFAVWNVVFDRAVVVAGRQYVHAASASARGRGPYLRIDDWMRPAVARAFRTATATAVVVLITGFAAIAVAVRRRPEEIPCAPSRTR
jgi:hypothetical protein